MAWLRSAYPRAEIWTGWSETHLPGISVYPDALAWGEFRDMKPCFGWRWEIIIKAGNNLVEITKKRLDEAWEFCQKTGVRLVYAQLSVDWVQDTVRWAFEKLPPEMARVMGNGKKFGKLPVME